MSHKVWTSERVQELISYISDGATVPQLCEVYNCSEGHIRNVILELTPGIRFIRAGYVKHHNAKS